MTTAANKSGISVTVPDIIERLEDREDADDAPVSYSWVHINEFRLFELHDQCLPWSTVEELRETVDEIP